MRGKDLLECMEHIDDVLIEEALNPVIVPRWNKNNMVIKWGMTAACVIVIGISATALWSHQNIKEDYSGSNDNGFAAQMAIDSSTDDIEGNAAVLAGGNGQTTGALAGGTQVDETANTDADIGRYVAEKNAVAEDNSAADEATPLLQQSKDISDMKEEKSVSQESAKARYTVISDYSVNDGAVDCYAYVVPERGKSFCHQHLMDAIEYYSAREKESDSPLYAYAVVIDMFGDIETEDGIHYEQLNRTDAGNELIEQEYRRLIELGYSVRLSEDFQFMGTFTKEELDNFDALPEYGYAFRFENEE